VNEKHLKKQRGSWLYLTKDMLDAVLTSMAVRAKSKAERSSAAFKMSRSIDQECGVGELLFLVKSTEKQHGKLRCARLKQPYMGEFARAGIGRGVSPVSLTVDVNHRFVNRNLIRTHIAVGL